MNFDPAQQFHQNPPSFLSLTRHFIPTSNFFGYFINEQIFCMKCTLLTSLGGLGLGVGRFLARGAENGKKKSNLIKVKITTKNVPNRFEEHTKQTPQQKKFLMPNAAKSKILHWYVLK